MRILTDHHDGLGAHERVTISADERAADDGLSHEYMAEVNGQEVLRISFQGGKNATKDGVTERMLLAILKDRLESTQLMPATRNRHVALAATAVEQAMMWLHARAMDAARAAAPVAKAVVAVVVAGAVDGVVHGAVSTVAGEVKGGGR